MSWYVVSVAMRTKTKKTCVVKRVEHVLNNRHNLRGEGGGDQCDHSTNAKIFILITNIFIL